MSAYPAPPLATSVGQTLLTYQLAVDPDPPQVGQACVLRLTVRGGPNPAFGRKITLSLPTGTGANHFTNAPNTITPQPVQGGEDDQQGGGWDLTPGQANGQVTFTAIPAHAPGWLLGVTPLVVELTNVTVNAALGAATLRIEEDTSLAGVTWETRTTELPLPKFPEGFVFQDLRPDLLMVANGGHATLTWRGSPATYTLTWGGQHGGTGGTADVSNVTSWTSPPLHDTTAFRLAARMPGSDAERVLTTLVTVANPHLNVHDLTTNGSVRLIGSSQPLPVTRGQPHTFQPDTDGILITRVRAAAGNTAAKIEVLTRAEDNSVEYQGTVVSNNSDTDKLPVDRFIDVPIRRGTTVVITCDYMQTPPNPEPVEPSFAVLWLPFGNNPRAL